MEAQQPMMSQYRGNQYIKQMEDVFMPPQPYVNKGFPQQGRPLVPPNYAQLHSQPVPIAVNSDFLPFHKDFNRYLYNQIIGYTDKETTYPIYTSGFGRGFT